MKALAVTSVLLLAASAAAFPAEDGPPTVILMPLANSSVEPAAPTELLPVLLDRLELSGFRVITDGQLEAVLARRRIRYTDSLSRADALALVEELGADFVLVGRVLSFHRGPVPQVGLTLRLIDPGTGEVIWSRMLCRMGSQYAGLLGLGEVREIDELLQLVVKEALATLGVDPDTGAVRAQLDGRVRRRRLAPDPISYVRKGPALDRVRTIGLLPLRNLSDRQGADLIVRDILVARLWATGRYRVMEPGELREQILRRGLFPNQVAGRDVLGQLKRELGLDAILGGTVLQFRESPQGAGQMEPKVELAVRMVSTDAGTILWDALHFRRGEDAVSFYDAGRIPAADRLAQAVIDDLLASLPRRKGGAR